MLLGGLPLGVWWLLPLWGYECGECIACGAGGWAYFAGVVGAVCFAGAWPPLAGVVVRGQFVVCLVLVCGLVRVSGFGWLAGCSVSLRTGNSAVVWMHVLAWVLVAAEVWVLVVCGGVSGRVPLPGSVAVCGCGFVGHGGRGCGCGSSRSWLWAGTGGYLAPVVAPRRWLAVPVWGVQLSPCVLVPPLLGMAVVGGFLPRHSSPGAYWAGWRCWAVPRQSWQLGLMYSPVFPGWAVVSVLLDLCAGARCPRAGVGV